MLVLRREHGLRVPAKVRPCHRDDVHLVARDEPPHLAAQPVVRIAAHVVELVHRDQPAIEGLHAQLIDSKAKRGMGTHQHRVCAGQKLANRFDLRLRYSRLIDAGCVAEIPLRPDGPVGPEAVRGQRLVCEAAADRALRDEDNGLLQPLVVQLVERDEHQRAGLARGRRRFDKQVLLAAAGIGALLHGPHAQRVGFARPTGASRGDRDRGNRPVVRRSGCRFSHAVAFFLAAETLRHAHEQNDDTLERIYIGRRFRNDTERLEKLFEMYTKMTAAQPATKKALMLPNVHLAHLMRSRSHFVRALVRAC